MDQRELFHHQTTNNISANIPNNCINEHPVKEHVLRVHLNFEEHGKDAIWTPNYFWFETIDSEMSRNALKELLLDACHRRCHTVENYVLETHGKPFSIAYPEGHAGPPTNRKIDNQLYFNRCIRAHLNCSATVRFKKQFLIKEDGYFFFDTCGMDDLDWTYDVLDHILTCSVLTGSIKSYYIEHQDDYVIFVNRSLLERRGTMEDLEWHIDPDTD